MLQASKSCSLTRGHSGASRGWRWLPSLLPRSCPRAGEGGAGDPAQSPREDVRELPEPFPNWTQETRRCQGPGSPGLKPPSRAWLGSRSRLANGPWVDSGFGSQREVARPHPFPGGRRRKTRRHASGGVAGEAGRGWGRRSRSRRRKQPPPQLRRCGPGLPAGGRRERVLSSFSTRLAHVRPAPPGLAPAAPATASSPADAGGGKASASAFKRRGHGLRPHPPPRASKGWGVGGGAGTRGGARALVRRRSGWTADRVFPKWRQRWMWIPRAAPTAARARSALK